MKNLILLLSVIFYSAIGWAFTDAEKLQNKLNHIRSLSAHFKETLTSETKQINQTQGTLEIQKPGRFRWETLAPVSQLILADGKKIWIYDIDLEQVTVKSQKSALKGTPALFLSGDIDSVIKNYTISLQELPNHDERYELHARSKQANFKSIAFVFQQQTIKSMSLEDNLAQKTELKFTKIKQNIAIPFSRFKIQLPRGVDVINE